MPSQEELTSKLDIRSANDEDRERVVAMNLGGESPIAGAPVVISHGLHIHDPVRHEELLRQNPPQAAVPAQDPTPLPEMAEGELLAGTARRYPPQGGPGAVRRVDDRTPEAAAASAGAPYNLDTSVAQRAGLTGQDAAEETAEGKHAEGGARARVAEAARAEHDERLRHTGETDEERGSSSSTTQDAPKGATGKKSG